MSNNPIEAISLDAIEKAISITEQYIEAIYEATSSDKKPHLKQDGLSYCSLALKLLPPENDFIDMYRGLQRILNLPYHESELYSVNVYINEDGLFEKIETIENELIKRQTEIRWLRGEKGEQVAETGKEGVGAKIKSHWLFKYILGGVAFFTLIIDFFTNIIGFVRLIIGLVKSSG